MKKRILTLVCTLAIAFCSVLGFNSIRNVENVSVHATETETYSIADIKDLTNTSWELSGSVGGFAVGDHLFSIDFESNAVDRVYSQFRISVSDTSASVMYRTSEGSQTTVIRDDGTNMGKSWLSISIYGGLDNQLLPILVPSSRITVV